MNKKEEQRKILAQQVRKMNVYDLYNKFVENDIYRAFIVFENGEFNLSHPKVLKPIQAFFELSQDFAQHEGIFIGREEGLETLFFAFIHDTRRGLAQGGLRFSKYNTLADLLVDGIRLSQGMTRKNALAGLWWGGGKGIMVFPPDITNTEQLQVGSVRRRSFFEGYGRFIASLGGVYYTAEDVGTNTDDMNAVLSQNRFTTCISASNGGSGNPSPFTARGVFRAMQAGWKVISGNESLQGVKVSVQGAGNVGYPLIKYLYESGAKVYFCDMSETRIKQAIEEMPELTLVTNEEIFDLDVDVFAPCAIGAQVNSQTIPRLKVKLVCGAANNILKEPEADALNLKERGIAFVPDFVCNRMGIINCADEWLGYLGEDIRVAAERVFPDTLRVFKYAKNRSVTTMQAAKDLADIAASELHPMILHRGRRIIDHLINSGWHKNEIQKNETQELAFVPVLDETDIRVGWEKRNAFRGNEITIAASPISAASNPDLYSFLSPLLLDIRARSLELITGKKTRRILGSNHGGLSLQIAIEQQIPYEREEVGKPRFLELCHDSHKANDEEIRKQLHKIGIGFDHNTWLNPMAETGKNAVDKLYRFLSDSHLITRQNDLLNYCPDSQTILVSSDVNRAEINVENRYILKFKTKNNQFIETVCFFPEYLLGAVAIAVSPKGRFKDFVGESVFDPSRKIDLPVILLESMSTDAEFITPIHSHEDLRIARENGFDQIIKIFNDNGTICSKGYEYLSKEDARNLILNKFSENVIIEKGNFKASVLRNAKSESILITKYSSQLFVKLEEAKELFYRAVEDDLIRFSHPNWKTVVLNYLKNIDFWCISRQYWWGNEIPDKAIGEEKEVFSTWFSLSAMALQGAGWLENPKPMPIDEVFVNPDYLIRWVIPSQLISLIVVGRPVFTQINVHGSLHVVERLLKPVDGVDNTANDEERFTHNTIKRPMQKRLGNVIEPVTLIRRFGADSLRLAYLLSLGNGFQQQVTASQDHFNLAKNSLHKFVTKLTNIMNILKKQNTSSQTQNDLDIIEKCNKICDITTQAYHDNRLGDAAKYLVEMNDYFVKYCNNVAEYYHETNNSGQAFETLDYIIKKMKDVFSPICPYQFEKLSSWMDKQKNILNIQVYK